MPSSSLPSVFDMRTEPLTEADLAGYWSTRIEPWVFDFDHLGHLTAAVYPKAFEEGRTRYFRDRWDVSLPVYVVAKHLMHYAKEIKEDAAPIHVLIRPVRIGNASLDFEELLLDDHKHVCNVSQVTLVAWDLEGRRSRPIAGEERTALEADLKQFKGLSSRTI